MTEGQPLQLLVLAAITATIAGGCGFGDPDVWTFEKSLERGKPGASSVACVASDALPYVRDFMPGAENADDCVVEYVDGGRRQFCVVSRGSGELMMATPDSTCVSVAASYGRGSGPGLYEPGELQGLIDEARATSEP